MTMTINKNVNFRKDNGGYMINYNNRYTPPMPEQSINDLFLLQAEEQSKAAKKERSKERWYKAGIMGQVALGAGVIAMTALTLWGMIKGTSGASKNTKLVWENISKNKKFPALEDDCVNPKVREFIKNIKNRDSLSKEVMNYTGMKNPEQCILMYGPPGTGKTFSGQLLAKELGAEYTKVQFADVSSPFVGQTSVEIQDIFKKLKKIATKNPNKKYVVSFDEIDALLVPREKCGSNNLHLAENRTAFLNGLDSIKDCQNLKIIGTTNVHPESGNLDKASLSRFKNNIEIELPTEKELVAALKFQLKDVKAVQNHKFFENNKSEVEKFAKELREKKYSQRDIEDIAGKANEKFGFSVANSKNVTSEKFDIKFLKEAVETKGNVTGTIDAEAIPAWQMQQMQRQNMPSFAKPKGILQRIKFLFTGNL